MLRLIIFLLPLFSIIACSGNAPGSLAGNWRIDGIIPMTVQFRPGETESLGLIEKVSYEIKGNDVLVTSVDGPAKGLTVRYTMTGKNTAHTELGRLQRIQ